ncbi:hypothetical protein GPJ56_007249 [Histomonas meleagridis]|uniref:uncharacterized protein n=1 Tax=Histomonas meleagridis TaxID=135588 RepID=UPI00355AA437|nr:hypothetical protein GPJ56_007249 [Histomonas meleagridis]KAH0804095.1 hypothetical protein GO595_002925 [Histomonas meleagridis]
MFLAVLFLEIQGLKERYACGANLYSYLYDLSDSTQLDPIIYNDNLNDYKYTFKLCGELPQESFPQELEYQYGVSGFRCKISNPSECEVISYYSTQDYDFVTSETHPDDGITMVQKAQNYNEDEDFNIFELVHVVKCDATKTDFNVESVTTTDNNGVLTISVQYSNKYGCSTGRGNIPDPDPTVESDCTYSANSQVVYPYAVDIDLSKFKYAIPYGIPHQVNSSSFVLVNPCGISNCPPGKTCDSTDASIWICTSDDTCKSFGSARKHIGIAERTDNTDEGIIVSYDPHITESGQSIASNMHVTCDFELHPETTTSSMIHISKFEVDKNGEGYIVATSPDLCMQPSPTPNPAECSATFPYGGEQKTIDIRTFNKLNGIYRNIKLNPSATGSEHNLFLQPCGGLNCPGATCDDPNGATVWLCAVDGGQPSDCDPYGDFAEKITVLTNDGIENGIKIHYISESGRHKLSSDLIITCDWLQPKQNLRINKNVNLINWSNLEITAYANELCVGEPPWYPPTPVPTVMPSPAPAPGYIIHREKNGQYVEFDMRDMFEGANNEYNVTIRSGTKSIQGIFSYYPFYPKRCPTSICEISDTADAWICFMEHCYPIANHQYNIDLFSTEFIDSTTYLIEGYSNYRTQFTINCDDTATSLILDDEIYLSDSGSFHVDARASFACPKVNPSTSASTSESTPTPTTSSGTSTKSHTITYTATYTSSPTIAPKPTDKVKVSGGSVFLLIVFLIFVLYLSVGTLLGFILKGTIALPNEEFWSSVGDAILTTFRAMMCRRQNEGYVMADDPNRAMYYSST